MTTIGSTSSSSGIDPATMAAQLVAAERAPTDTRYAATQTKITAQVSAVATLRSAFSNLDSSLTVLQGGSTANARAVSLSANTGFSATAAAGAARGSYNVEVLSLAAAQKLASSGFSGDGSAVVGTGNLSISYGGKTLSVDITTANGTLSGIRDAINTAAGGSGISASIVSGDDGAHLVLTSLDGGTANQISVTASGGDGGLAAFAYDGSAGSGMTQLVAASDAQVKVDGVLRTSSSNTITDLVQGVTLNLKAAAPGTVISMDVATDTSAQLSAVKDFVDKFNAALYAIASTTNYNASTKVAAALNGDAMVRGVSSQLRNTLSANVVDLKSLGISIGTDGTLTLDQTQFNAGLSKDPAALSRVFGSGSDTMAGKMATTMGAMIDSGGLLSTRSDSLTAQTKKLDAQKEALDTRMAAAEARYKAQFTALDTMMTKLQSTSDFLTQQLNKSSSED
ncbi:flagellar filament capping protein FliD [Pseudoxanthomonas winnipegensis]|uniref:Flagellar hook-associated protein 2 n=1 Tax=Pseudoxanthomonas winnipegensis TaxID=2480810 RepID=A0A4Q8LPR2_9GAMM|nr:flagellar filament capping protein FliD [Pseudoxanthomonas winnipegensis]RZZ89305.1 flagellar protein [Pseudoxanthomonas winnipegensis]TAA33249.1 flagellar protein [Pseudoxanthomonas winnipegensis]TBV72769.1 flagellar protein [Pseudoxanthomonas winnipegensis]